MRARVRRVASVLALALALAALALAASAEREENHVDEPRCERDARAYADATAAFRAPVGSESRHISCADVADALVALRPLRESACEETRARARMLSAELASARGAWEDAEDAIAGLDRSRGVVRRIREVLAIERSRARAEETGDWQRAYELAGSVVSASACSANPNTFQNRARAALKLGMSGRAFVDGKIALALGGSRAEAFETMAVALDAFADSAERIADVQVLARFCLRHAPESAPCLKTLKKSKMILSALRTAEEAELREDWDGALKMYGELRNTEAKALRVDTLIALCRVHGERARAKWMSGVKKGSLKALSEAIDMCTDVLGELMTRGEETSEDITQTYKARAWMRVLTANADGAAADVAGMERSGATSRDWRLSIEELREAIEAARAASALKDLYSILGLKREDANGDDWLRVLKRAYRRLALILHPDKNPVGDKEEAEEKFHELVNAYKILSSETLRREYDATGKVRLGMETAATGDWFEDDASDTRAGGAQGEDFNMDDYVFRYDRRDAGADGRARGQFVHKQTGERVFGERDVRSESEQREDVCAKTKGYCIEGRGGTTTSHKQHATGVEPIVVKMLTARTLPGDSIAARIVRNHFGFQSLEFLFVFDVELPGDDTRKRQPREAAKSRLRRLVRTLHTSLVGREATSALTSMIEEKIVNLPLASKGRSHILDYVASALNGASQGFSSEQTLNLLYTFASEATREMRRLGALGLKSDERTDNFVRVARDLVANPMVLSHLLLPGDELVEEVHNVRSLVALWRDDIPCRPFTQGDFLSYEMKLSDSDDSSDVRAISATLDFETDTGLRLGGLSTAVDQFGFSAALPSVNFREVIAQNATNGWITRRVAIPRELFGAKPVSWLVAASRVDAGRARVRIRDAKIVNNLDPDLDVVRVFHSKHSL